MIPSYWIFLSSLPMTGTGKIDRKKLPWPVDAPFLLSSSSSRDSCSSIVVEPRNDLERHLRSLFAAVLGRAETSVSVERSFFADYGGNSLMAAQLAAQITMQFHVNFFVVQVITLQVCIYFLYFSVLAGSPFLRSLPHCLFVLHFFDIHFLFV
jgi:hypothetical protein